MSTLSSRHDQASRNWWPSSKPPKYPGQEQDMPANFLPEKSSRSSSKGSNGKFNTLASAIGFKSKKHPSLAIQDPPMPTRTVVSTIVSEAPHARSYTNRPPSKSVSSTRSQATSSEPRTPLDYQRDTRDHRHQSLLTLSDADPFAAGAITVPLSPDPGRLSVYSNTSLDYSKRSDPMTNRVSYASTSSYSHGHGDTHASVTRASSASDKRKLSSKKSAGDLHRNTCDTSRDAAWENLVYPNGKLPKAGSSPIADKHRLSQPDTSQVARPLLRARGLTESGGIHQPNLFSNVKSANKTSPRVIVRQASLQRMGMPPSAPPTHSLPTPPAVNIPIVDTVDVLLDHSHGSSPSLSYPSSILSRDDYMPNQHYVPREDRLLYRDIAPTESHVINLSSSPKSTKTLKKSISHNSLSKRSPSGSATPQSASETSDKVPRKQRSFHHPRIPMPPIPLPLRQIGAPVITTDSPDKRGSTSSGISHRKRLFSGSSFGRPHTASSIQHSEEDKCSVFSLPLEAERSGSGSLSKVMSPSSSFWDETTAPSSPHATTQEYIPQHIITPAEMLKVEASVQDAISTRKTRQRGLSVLSSTTSASEFSVGEGLAAPFGTNSLSSPSSPYSKAHSNSQTTLTSITSTSFFSSPSASASLQSLPPQRRRQPPIPNAETGIIPLSPPPRTKIRRKQSTESGLSSTRRSSMMRKPSFLDIGDDVRKERRRPSTAPRPEMTMNDSFLDLARESFDSERSLEDHR